MSDTLTASQVTDIVDFQLLATVLALSTRDLDDQDGFIEVVLSEISKRSDRAITKIAGAAGVPDSLRNQLFAECAGHVAQIRQATLGVAKDLRASR